MELGLVFDAVVVIMLSVTIFTCVSLHRRLAAIRGAQAEMRALGEQLGVAALRAESGIASLRAVASEVADKLDPRLGQARTLVDDLDMLCHRAGKLADGMVGGTQRPPASTTAARGRRPQSSRSERALIEALKAAR